MVFMKRQFWNREATNKSLKLLGSLTNHVDFVLIGGWAVYMYVGAQKSQDIDIVVDYDSLNYFRQFGISEYPHSKIKYSVVDGVVVDLFVEEFIDPDMPFPSKMVLDNYVRMQSIKVVDRNILILLKLWGYFSADEIKHRKDIIDVVSLLFYGGIDLKKVRRYVERYKIDKRKSSDAMLEYLDIGITLAEFIVEKKGDYAKLRERCRASIKKIFE
jgi:hypothetical protein